MPTPFNAADPAQVLVLAEEHFERLHQAPKPPQTRESVQAAIQQELAQHAEALPAQQRKTFLERYAHQMSQLTLKENRAFKERQQRLQSATTNASYVMFIKVAMGIVLLMAVLMLAYALL